MRDGVRETMALGEAADEAIERGDEAPTGDLTLSLFERLLQIEKGQ